MNYRVNINKKDTITVNAANPKIAAKLAVKEFVKQHFDAEDWLQYFNSSATKVFNVTFYERDEPVTLEIVMKTVIYDAND